MEDAGATGLWFSSEGLKWLLCNASDAELAHSGTAPANVASFAAQRPPAGAPIWRADGFGALDSAKFASARHANVSPHTRWEDYYSPAACEVIQRRFAVDFEAFGYDASECQRAMRLRENMGK